MIHKDPVRLPCQSRLFIYRVMRQMPMEIVQSLLRCLDAEYIFDQS